MIELVILDRDGVINQDSDQFIKSVDEFVLLPRTIKALKALKVAGYTIAIATNQSGIARGLYSRADLHAMHVSLQQQLAPFSVDWINYSPYLVDTPCRKPNSGMYQAIAWRFGLTSFDGVSVIGDSWRDLQAAHSVGANPILVKTGKGAKTLQQHAQAIAQANIKVAEDLASAVELMGVTL